MLVSTRGRYALRVMLDLAQHRKEGYISLKEVALRQDISMKYLESIIAVLNRAGMVQSLRGKDGGYRLSRPDEEYTVGSILKLTEGSLAPVSCLDPSGATPCDRTTTCLTLPLWKKLDYIIDDYLEGITLADILYNKI